MDNREIMSTEAAAAVFAVLASIVKIIKQLMDRHRYTMYETIQLRELNRRVHTYHILFGGRDNCRAYIRMSPQAFFTLVKVVKDFGSLRDSPDGTVEEQLMSFLHTCGHNPMYTADSEEEIHFIRSEKLFRRVLGAINGIKHLYMEHAKGETHPYIATNPDFSDYFKDCIGIIDGTHVSATVSSNISARFRSRKGITQHVLAAVSLDLKFTYVLAGWEGSANNFAVLKNAITRPPPCRLHVPEGKYYLVGGGYTTMPGFISPYQGVRCRLKEYAEHAPQNANELFNFSHSSLRSCIDRAFRILKNRFKIISEQKPFSYVTQVELVLACSTLHNFILQEDPCDEFVTESEAEEEISDDEAGTVHHDYFGQSQTRGERKIWLDLRDRIANDMWRDYCNRRH